MPKKAGDKNNSIKEKLEYIGLDLENIPEELKAQADGKVDIEDGEGLREGFVYRSKDGITSFKNVSNQYLLEKGE